MVSSTPEGVTPWAAESCRRILRDARSLGITVTHVWGYAAWPDHVNRRCVDYMVPTKRDGRLLAAYIVRHAEQLRVEYLISNRRQWRAYRKGVHLPRTWAPYFGRSPHVDHVHVQVAGD